MLNEEKYRMSNEDLKAGEIVGIRCRHYVFGFGNHSFVFYKKGGIIKVSPKKTKITIKYESGVIETFSNNIAIIKYTEEVEKYNAEMRLRNEVYNFITKISSEIPNLNQDVFVMVSNMSIDRVNLIYNSIATLKDNIEDTLKECD